MVATTRGKGAIGISAVTYAEPFTPTSSSGSPEPCIVDFPRSPPPPPKGRKVTNNRVTKPAVKKAAVKKAAVKGAAVKKAVVKKAVVKKAVVKKAAVKKAAVKKATKTKNPKEEPKTVEELQEKLDKNKIALTFLRKQRRNYEKVYRIFSELATRAQYDTKHPGLHETITQVLHDCYDWEDLVAELEEVEKKKGFKYKLPERQLDEYEEWVQTRPQRRPSPWIAARGPAGRDEPRECEGIILEDEE